MIHLFLFLLLSILLASVPLIASPKKKGSGFLKNFQLPKKINFINLQKIFQNSFYPLNLFDQVMNSSFDVLSLWIAGFISWILGCCLWVQQSIVFSITFILGSMIFCILAIIVMPKKNFAEFQQVGKEELKLSPFVLSISISVVIMIATKSYANGITTNILLLLFWYLWMRPHEVKI